MNSDDWCYAKQVLRATAHEQFARLILNYEDNLELSYESLPVECRVIVTDAEEEYDRMSRTETTLENLTIAESVRKSLGSNISASRQLIAPYDPENEDQGPPSSSGDECLALSKISSSSMSVVRTSTDPISSKLAAVHHVSEAIKSLRWIRQLQSSEQEFIDQGTEIDYSPASVDLSVCACGDADCIEVCDIREWLPKSKLDNKTWKLVLLLGESYLALAEAHKEDGQLGQTLKTVELACSVYGSMPQHLGDTKFISSMTKCLSAELTYSGKYKKARSSIKEAKEMNVKCLTYEQLSSVFLFWAKAWTLVADVYVEFHRIKDSDMSTQTEEKPYSRELRMSSGVAEEVERLKRKLSRDYQNCSSCSLVNCSCQSDRASSGSSASSSSGDKRTFGRKSRKRSHAKGASHPHLGDPEDACAMCSTPIETETALKDPPKRKTGGIFKYLEGPIFGDFEHNLSYALDCYEEAGKALHALPTVSAELQSVLKKKGWVCNELGRIMLERKELIKAEIAFVDAINAFREVSDHINVILINCNLGHGRRALAEEMVSKAESLKPHTMFHDAYKQALETAKQEYCESLRFYGAAKLQLKYISSNTSLESMNLRNEVHTQIGHTYLRVGILLAREDTTTEVYDHAAMENIPRKEARMHEISANDAIREAISMYESMGDLRKQEAAYAYFHLACYQRDCCLKFLESDTKAESNIGHRIKQYASLAKRNWQKSIEFYGPQTHPTMYLNVLIEMSALSASLSSALHSNVVCILNSLISLHFITLLFTVVSNLTTVGFLYYTC